MSDSNLSLAIAAALQDVPAKTRKAFASGSWPSEEAAMRKIAHALSTEIQRSFAIAENVQGQAARQERVALARQTVQP